MTYSFQLGTGATVALFALICVISLYMTVVKWLIFTKSGRPGWWCLIPFLRNWQWFKIGGLPGFLSILPIVNLFCYIVAQCRVIKKFGMGFGMVIMGLFMALIPLTCIAFNPLVEYDF